MRILLALIILMISGWMLYIFITRGSLVEIFGLPLLFLIFIPMYFVSLWMHEQMTKSSDKN
jgi:hypothetical protein